MLLKLLQETHKRYLINRLLTRRLKENKIKAEWVDLDMIIFTQTKRILVPTEAIERKHKNKQKQMEKIQKCNQESKAKEWNHKAWCKNQKI